MHGAKTSPFWLARRKEIDRQHQTTIDSLDLYFTVKQGHAPDKTRTAVGIDGGIATHFVVSVDELVAQVPQGCIYKSL